MLWAGPSDEHCKVASPWSCDEHHIFLMFEERTRQEVLVYILAVLDALVFFFFRSRFSDYFCKCCTVWSRDTHCAMSRLKASCPQVLVRIWNLLRVLGCDNVPVMISDISHCMVFMMSTRPPRSESPLWQVMIGVVEAIHVLFQWRSQSSRLCWNSYMWHGALPW